MGNNIEDKLNDEIDQLIFEFAVGREKTVPPHIRTLLINSQPTVIKLKQAIQAIITTETTKAANEAALEELEELYTMAKTNYEHTGNPNMKTLGQYCSNRIKALQKEQKG